LPSELHVRLAQLDSTLARLQGKSGGELRAGVQEIGSILRRMSSVADRGGQPAQAELRRLIEERKEQLRQAEPVHDLQDVDAAAVDTWVGSGEGAKLFPEVFGASIPAEGAVVGVAETEALRSEHTYPPAPSMETLNLRKPEPGFRIAADGEGMGASSGIHTVRRNRSRGHEVGAKDTLPDGEEFLELVSGRVYELLMEELEQAFESR
jgi:hypothetical protein